MPFVFCRRQVSQSGREVLHVFLVSIAVPSPPQPRVSVKHLIKNKKCSLFTIGRFDEEEEAARAYNKAIRDAGLEVKRHINAVDATGALMPRKYGSVRSAVVAPDPARAPAETSSKFWGVSWDKNGRRWMATYNDATGKKRWIGLFDTQEAAAHAVNAAIRALPPDVQRRRQTNPVVDGQLVPRARKAPGHGCDALRKRPRGVDPAAPPRRSARRSRQE